jgi:hypothetical protein
MVVYLFWDSYYEHKELARVECHFLFVSGGVTDAMRLLGFSHSAVGWMRGTLGLFELFSSSCSPSSQSSLLPLILSPSPSSESV